MTNGPMNQTMLTASCCRGGAHCIGNLIAMQAALSADMLALLGQHGPLITLAVVVLLAVLGLVKALAARVPTIEASLDSGRANAARQHVTLRWTLNTHRCGAGDVAGGLYDPQKAPKGSIPCYDPGNLELLGFAPAMTAAEVGPHGCWAPAPNMLFGPSILSDSSLKLKDSLDPRCRSRSPWPRPRLPPRQVVGSLAGGCSMCPSAWPGALLVHLFW
jgi:hypothetical protein